MVHWNIWHCHQNTKVKCPDNSFFSSGGEQTEAEANKVKTDDNNSGTSYRDETDTLSETIKRQQLAIICNKFIWKS